MKEISNGGNIYLGYDYANQIKEYGDIPINLPNENVTHIHNVMYVPQIEI